MKERPDINDMVEGGSEMMQPRKRVKYGTSMKPNLDDRNEDQE